MPKKDVAKKNKKPKSPTREEPPASEEKAPSRTDAVRSAAAQAIEAAGHAGFTRERAQQLADELVSAAGRFRETLEELRPAGADELRALRERIAALEGRVAKLERAPAPNRAPTRRRRPAKAAAKPAAKQPADTPAGPPAESHAEPPVAPSAEPPVAPPAEPPAEPPAAPPSS